MAIEVGKAAPAFTLKNEKGEAVSLKDFRGKNVIVYFYPRDNTPGCTKEAQGFRKLWGKIQNRDAVVLGVSPDPDKKVMSKYGAFGEKMMYGKKVVGVIRSTVWVDPKGKVKKHWARVPKAADHPAKVLEALQEE